MWAVINKEGQDEDRLKFRDAFGGQERCGGTMKRFSIPYDPNSFYSADGARQISMTVLLRRSRRCYKGSDFICVKAEDEPV